MCMSLGILVTDVTELLNNVTLKYTVCTLIGISIWAWSPKGPTDRWAPANLLYSHYGRWSFACLSTPTLNELIRSFSLGWAKRGRSRGRSECADVSRNPEGVTEWATTPDISQGCFIHFWSRGLYWDNYRALSNF